MPRTQPITDLPADRPDVGKLPDEHREFIEQITAAGMITIPGRKRSGWTLPEPIRANTSLSDAIIEDREEGGR